MSGPGFKIANKAWARQEFPRRLMKVAIERHGYDPSDTYGINVDISNLCDVDKSMVTRYLKGAVPRAATVIRIAEAYRVSPDWLVGNDDAPEGGFTLADLEARLPFDTFQNVVRIMYKAQDDLERKPSNEDFARASVEVLKMVVDNPSMPEYAVFGAARMLLQEGPGALAKPKPE